MSVKTEQHTPTPQELHLRSVLSDKDYSPERIEEIVRAVNSHEALLEQLERCKNIVGVHGTDQTTGETFFEGIKKAIAQAEGNRP